MYPRPKSLELLIEIREEMARQADFDVDLFVENVRTGKRNIDLSDRSVDAASPEKSDRNGRRVRPQNR
ncbi:MAG: hypothetical protein ACRD6X_08780 [Pyrinomonadaceae bacterium]